MHWRGELLHLHTTPRGGAPMEAVREARFIAGAGIEGDRYTAGLGTYSARPHVDRQVTLIEAETLEALVRDRKITLAPQEHRRNLTTRGVPLNHLVGHYFRVGECVLYGGRLNVPCVYLENLLGKKVFKPLLNRSGLNCRIIVGGTVRVGDAIEWCDPNSLDAAVRQANESIPVEPAPEV
jgi:MOSC domain-containing protein YiiM